MLSPLIEPTGENEHSDVLTTLLTPTPVLSEVPRLLPCGHEQRTPNARFCSVWRTRSVIFSRVRTSELSIVFNAYKCVVREQLYLLGNEFIFPGTTLFCFYTMFIKNKVTDSNSVYLLQISKQKAKPLN
jgi:hypothetical protein